MCKNGIEKISLSLHNVHVYIRGLNEGCLKKILHVYIYICNAIQYRCSATKIYRVVSSYSNEETCRLSLFTTRPSHRYSLIVTPVLLILLLLTIRRSQWQNQSLRMQRVTSGRQGANPEVLKFFEALYTSHTNIM